MKKDNKQTDEQEFYVEGDGFTGPYSPMHWYLLGIEGMTSNAITLLFYYMRVTTNGRNKCYQSIATISDNSPLTKNTIAPARKLLAKLGLITIISGEKGQHYTIRINFKKMWRENAEWWLKQIAIEDDSDPEIDPDLPSDIREGGDENDENLPSDIQEGDGEDDKNLPSDIQEGEGEPSDIQESPSDNQEVSKRLLVKGFKLSKYGNPFGSTALAKLPIPPKPSKPIGRPADFPQETEKEELPNLITFINSFLQTKAKITSSGKGWDELSVQPFTYTNQSGQIIQMDAPADLWDIDPDYREWATQSIEYCNQHKGGNATSRNAIVNFIKNGNRNKGSEKLSWVSFLGQKRRIDPTIVNANPHANVEVDTSALI